MIQVSISTTTKRYEAITIPASTTLRQAFDQVGADYSRGITSIDGIPVGHGGLDKSFADFGITEKCTLWNVVKADNA